VVHIVQLLRHGEQRAQHDAHRLFLALALVNDAVGQRIGAQPFGDSPQRSVGYVMGGAAHAAIQRGAGEAKPLGGAQDRLHGIVYSRPGL
jgi:hypothetical protein